MVIGLQSVCIVVPLLSVYCLAPVTSTHPQSPHGGMYQACLSWIRGWASACLVSFSGLARRFMQASCGTPRPTAHVRHAGPTLASAKTVAFSRLRRDTHAVTTVPHILHRHRLPGSSVSQVPPWAFISTHVCSCRPKNLCGVGESFFSGHSAGANDHGASSYVLQVDAQIPCNACPPVELVKKKDNIP